MKLRLHEYPIPPRKPLYWKLGMRGVGAGLRRFFLSFYIREALRFAVPPAKSRQFILNWTRTMSSVSAERR